MVSRIGGTGPVLPPQDRTAAHFKDALLKYIATCSALEPDKNLEKFANETVALTKIARDAQI